MSNDIDRGLKRILRQAKALQTRIRDDIAAKTFAADDVNMNAYSQLLVEALTLLPNDLILQHLEPMPDNATQGYAGPFSIGLPPNDFVTRRTEVHVSRLIDRLENLLDVDDEIVAVGSEADSPLTNTSNQASVIRVLIASPSDVDEEREAIRRVMEQWNAQYSSTLGVVLLPVDWKTHATPEMGERPQGILNRQLVETSDIVVAVFWTRLRTPTGSADSGTVEEIQHFISRGKPAMLYFSSREIDPRKIDSVQYQRLGQFKSWCSQNGIYSGYESVPEFESRLLPDLLRTVQYRFQAKHQASNNGINKNQGDSEVAQFLDAFATAIHRVEAEWNAERDSDPLGTDGGKAILNRASRQALDLRVMPLAQRSQGIADSLDEFLREASRLQRHELTLGSDSFEYFWSTGDGFIDRLRDNIVRQVNTVSAGEG